MQCESLKALVVSVARDTMENVNRLPLRDQGRKEARDQKLTRREEAIADRAGARKRKCPCNICMGENFSMRFRAVVQSHLRLYGRHPYHRGSTEVCKLLAWEMSLIAI